MSDNALVMWAIAALLAVAVVGAQPSRERPSSSSPVLVAKQLIPAGTPSLEVRRMVVATTLPASVVELGAIASRNELSAGVTSRDVLPGAQLRTSDFG